KYFKEVRALCDRYDVLLVLDESQTGYGRLGTWFAYQELGIVPDIVCLSKGLGLGYPVSAVLMRDTLVPEGTFAMTHYSSHQNDAFSATVINAGIDYIENHRILERVSSMGEYFLEKLTQLCDASPHLENPRGKGLMLGADLYYDGATDYRPIYHTLYERCMDAGLIIQGTCGGRVLRFLPDYLISKEDVDMAMAVLGEELKNVL
ncbi:MAG: aminotransferase class III-fold pyridoxal phosphate-dependent enzyme, partial [Lachnospira sp.]|nr:aminotransferase class III-fold pyridoxal phosphate-dependent enzyme [Lachnospira sp.]